ncbi:hypothetical protein B566_EDAN014500 [Ephemera danica]|nr:hypothetical protein B566_EDAN014500 [Ephemera danica]
MTEEATSSKRKKLYETRSGTSKTYMPNAPQAQMSTEDFDLARDEFLKNLNRTDEQRHELERATIDQADSATPDGLTEDGGIVEITCPESAKDMTPDEDFFYGPLAKYGIRPQALPFLSQDNKKDQVLPKLTTVTAMKQHLMSTLDTNGCPTVDSANDANRESIYLFSVHGYIIFLSDTHGRVGTCQTNRSRIKFFVFLVKVIEAGPALHQEAHADDLNMVDDMMTHYCESAELRKRF